MKHLREIVADNESKAMKDWEKYLKSDKGKEAKARHWKLQDAMDKGKRKASGGHAITRNQPTRGRTKYF